MVKSKTWTEIIFIHQSKFALLLTIDITRQISLKQKKVNTIISYGYTTADFADILKLSRKIIIF